MNIRMGDCKRMILDNFPKPFTPRRIQSNALLELQDSWNSHDVFVMNLPVASGKSFLAKTIQDFHKEGAIITPNNLLVQQYREDFPKLAGLIGRKNYSCHEGTSCDEHIKAIKKIRKTKTTCPDCPWFKDHKRMYSPWVQKYVTNYHLYAQMRKWQKVLIIDEAHNTIDFLREWHAIRISHKRWEYPRHEGGNINRIEMRKWITNLVGIKDIVDSPEIGQGGIAELYKELTSASPKYLLKETKEPQFDKEGNQVGWKLYLNLLPMDIRTQPPILWPRGVRKLILMSATIGEKDIEELGLDGKRVKFISADSCIPAEHRPVKMCGEVGVSGRNLVESIGQILEMIQQKSSQHVGEKGLVHATYDQANLLKDRLGHCKRFMFHTRENKKEIYQEFREATDDRILVASGLYEGIDLPQDAGRFQIVSKVPYPNLGEPAIKFRANKDRDWYTWQATKTMLQACGRICRGPNDFGVTYIVDKNFETLYNQNQNQYPNWFKEAVS